MGGMIGEIGPMAYVGVMYHWIVMTFFFIIFVAVVVTLILSALFVGQCLSAFRAPGEREADDQAQSDWLVAEHLWGLEDDDGRPQ